MSRASLRSRNPMPQALLVACLVLLPTFVGAQPYSADVTTRNDFDPGESAHDCTADPLNPITNCSFETGDFSGWGTVDMTVPLYPLEVNTAGVNIGFGFFTSAPTQGSFAALHGFDGDGPGTIQIYQDLTLPPGTGDMEFDYRGAWELVTFGATQDRTFTVEVEPSGGGGALQSDLILTAEAGTFVADTGPSSATVDLSGFAGDDVRISFEWFVPENLTGPGFFQLDNILVNVIPEADLVVTKECEVDGSVVTCWITVSNNGPGPASGVTAVDDIPAGLTYVDDDCGAGPPAGQVLTWDIGNLGVGESAMCHIEFEGIPGTGNLVQEVTVSGDQDDPNPDDNAVAVDIFVGTVLDIPTLSTVGLVLLALLLGGLSLLILKRRRAAQT